MVQESCTKRVVGRWRGGSRVPLLWVKPRAEGMCLLVGGMAELAAPPWARGGAAQILQLV